MQNINHLSITEDDIYCVGKNDVCVCRIIKYKLYRLINKFRDRGFSSNVSIYFPIYIVLFCLLLVFNCMFKRNMETSWTHMNGHRQDIKLPPRFIVTALRPVMISAALIGPQF